MKHASGILHLQKLQEPVKFVVVLSENWITSIRRKYLAPMVTDLELPGTKDKSLHMCKNLVRINSLHQQPGRSYRSFSISRDCTIKNPQKLYARLIKYSVLDHFRNPLPE